MAFSYDLFIIKIIIILSSDGFSLNWFNEKIIVNIPKIAGRVL